MQPIANPSAFFAADQEWLFRVRTWDTPQAVLENDVGSAGMRLRVYQPKADTVNWTAYQKALDAVAAGASPEAAFIDSTYAVATVPEGRWPLVQAYWGGGTPNWWGGAYTARVALCYSGVLVPAEQRSWLSAGSEFTFALAGSGWARIDVVEGGTRTTLFKGELAESDYLSNGFRYSRTKTFATGAELHVYYAQTTQDPWGGLVVKVLPGTRASLGLGSEGTAYTFAGGATAKAVAQTAPVLSCGLFSHAAAAAVELPFIVSANVTQEPGSATRAELEIPLVNASFNDGNGWVFYQQDQANDPGELQVYEGGVLKHTLKRKRLIQVQVARKATTPTWTPIFTGHVDDFSSGSNGRLTIQCVSFEGRMVEQYEQAPDRISYMARGFQLLDYADADADPKQPVYNVPAFDNWPLAWAVEELATRAGLDPSCFRKTWQAVQTNGTGVDVQLPWGTGKRFRAESLSGELVRMPRPVNYGNVGLSFTETRPYDDEYVFKIEPTKDLWARARELSDRLGYVCRFDQTGAAVLYPAASPSFVRDLVPGDVISGAVVQVTNPSAYGAKYLTVAPNVAATVRVNVRASRIDVSFPQVAGARSWTVAVAPAAGGDAVTTTVTTSSTQTTPELFFNSAVIAAGANRTVRTVFRGDYQEYTVTLTAASSASTAYVDCVLAYAQDPDVPKLPTLSTLEAASSVATVAQQDTVRNKVTIVGRRKAAVTDSDKFAEAQAPTEQEFVVQNAVDLGSITNPTASNYVGYLKQSVIYDDSITDEGLARYLAQVFIYRQSVPRAGTTVTHSLLPMLEPGDPLAVEETQYDTVSSTTVQYISRVSHQINVNKFQTTVQTDAWPQYPAYQPRTDINLADFDNKPITGLTVSYTSLSGHAVSNPSASLVKEVSGNTVSVSGVTWTSGVLNLSTALPWPPVPGSFQLKTATAPVPGQAQAAAKTLSVDQLRPDYTYGQRLWTFYFPEEANVEKVQLVFWQPDSIDPQVRNTVLITEATLGITSRDDYFYYDLTTEYVGVLRGSKALPTWESTTYCQIIVTYRPYPPGYFAGWLANNPYHRFVTINYQDNPATRVSLPWQHLTTSGLTSADATTFDVRYRTLFPLEGNVDPNGVVGGVSYSPFYDPYTSELGNLVSLRFSVLAEGLYRVSVRSLDDDTVVAWLTNPAATPTEADQHWEYLPVVADRQFTWDGVDQLGLWNGTQSSLYGELTAGAFDGAQRVGAGFYAWNRELSGGNLGPQAYVWMKRNADGTPIIGQGTYARWYVHVEAKTSTTADPEVSSKDDDVLVLTHLPEPTKLELKVQDQSGASWVTPESNVSATTLAAYVNATKGVRIRFRIASRPGELWTNNTGEVSVKLNREVHLRAVIGDQSVIYKGKEFPGSTVEDRTIYNRRFVNDEHTKQYKDTGYRKAKTFIWDDTDAGEAVTQWTFYPQDFKKDFLISGYEQSVEFCNYLQLEEVPEWNGARAVTAARSRLNFALMSYLFYLSAYVTDRSGRSSWGINRSFVDKSKINSNTATTDWPTDPMYEQRRTIVCRQWTNEATWKATQLTRFSFGSDTLFAKLLESFWWQHDVSATTIGAQSPVNWSSFSMPTDEYSHSHVTGTDNTGNDVDTFRLPSTYSTGTRQLGTLVGGLPQCYLGRRTNGTVQDGGWTWESSPLWIPSITRDLHPYFLLPPMVSPPKPNATSPAPGVERDFRELNCYYTVGGPTVKVPVRPFGQDKTSGEISTPDAGGAETWSSPVFDFTAGAKRFWPGSVVEIKKEPFKNSISNNAVNYVRQNEMVHYEDLRGIFSRGSYPAAQSIKVAPGVPYYLNLHQYRGIETGGTITNSTYPLFHAVVNAADPAASINWFRTTFRSEYLWESGSMFPTDRNGRERLEGVLWWKHRFVGYSNTLFYDFGAWVGWKDDLETTQVIGGLRSGGTYLDSNLNFGSPFSTGKMPVGVGPRLPHTMELVSHLVLVPERRGS